MHLAQCTVKIGFQRFEVACARNPGTTNQHIIPTGFAVLRQNQPGQFT